MAEQGSTAISARILSMVILRYICVMDVWVCFFYTSKERYSCVYCTFRISSGMGLVNLALDYEFSI